MDAVTVSVVLTLVAETCAVWLVALTRTVMRYDAPDAQRQVGDSARRALTGASAPLTAKLMASTDVVNVMRRR